VNNTIRQIGSVVGSAAVGAVLQHQLAGSLKDEAVRRAGVLPADLQSHFVNGFSGSGAALDIGGSRSKIALPSGLPTAVVQQVQQLSVTVFQHGYVRALHPSLALPILAMLVAAAGCLATQRQPGSATVEQSGQVPSASVAP
jgi:hypothetical protein